jgi:hypothetical protein
MLAVTLPHAFLIFILKDILQVRQFEDIFVTHATNPTSFPCAVHNDALDREVSVVGDDPKKFSRKKLDYTDETVGRTGQYG